MATVRYIATIAAIAASVIASTCDSENPGTEVDPNLYRVLDVLPDTVVRIGDRELRLPLDSLFGQELTGIDRYLVSNFATTVSTSLEDGDLTIGSNDVGTGLVVVRAFNDEPQTAIDSMQVTAVCMDHVFDWESNYLPVSLGKTWRYSYEEYQSGHYGRNTLRGSSTWEVVGIRSHCTDALVEVDIVETVDGIRYLEDRNYPPAPDSSFSEAWERTFSILMHNGKQGNKLEFELYPHEGVFWRGSAASDTVGFDYSYIYGFGYFANYRTIESLLVRGVGLVSYHRRYSGRDSYTSAQTSSGHILELQ